MNRIQNFKIVCAAVLFPVTMISMPGCRSTESWRDLTDRKAEGLLSKAQSATGESIEHIQIETPSDTLRHRLMLDQKILTKNQASLSIHNLPKSELWDGKKQLRPSIDSENFKTVTNETIRISLTDAVKIAAAGNSSYQSDKESLFSAALNLDLEEHNFRTSFTGLFSSHISSNATENDDGNDNDRETGLENSLKLGASKMFKNGTEVSSSIAVDLAQMLSDDSSSVWGILADASITIPLMRGSGKIVTMEPLTQAQRNLVYAVRDFERNKSALVVNVADAYLNVLLSKRQMLNQEENYKRVMTSTKRSRRMADAGRLQEYEFDQSYQNELSARNSSVASRMSYDSSLDSFKILLGLPPDCKIEPKEEELTALQKYAEAFAKIEGFDYGASDTNNSDGIGPMEISADKAVEIALENRSDLQTARDRIEDSQRHLKIAADGLRAEVTIGGSASVGESRSPGQSDNADFKIKDASYSGLLKIDLPFDRAKERKTYRESLISLEKAVRAYQTCEDSIKQAVRNSVRSLEETREKLKIQFMAVSLAERRVASTDLLLQAGRAEIRDVLDAQQSLLEAQNSLYSAITGYRMDELKFQRELGVLNAGSDGVWTEMTIGNDSDEIY